MFNIDIKEKKEIREGWVFDVEVTEDNESVEYEVRLLSTDWLRISDGGINPAGLIVGCFKFLIEREPKEAILRSFNIMDIGKYFPDFEHEIKKYF